jgi:hypothetical protein
VVELVVCVIIGGKRGRRSLKLVCVDCMNQN